MRVSLSQEEKWVISDTFVTTEFEILNPLSKIRNRKSAARGVCTGWDSNFIPRFTKMSEYWKNFSVIMFGIKNSAFPRNLSPWAHSRAEKTHRTIQILRVGEVPFKISFLKNAWCNRNQRLTEQFFTQGHGKINAFSSILRSWKFSYLANREP